MPTIKDYTVHFPDGAAVKVQGPDNLTDEQVFALGLQERGVKEGRIQTTWLGGAAKQMGEERGANAALATGAGLALGAPAVVAAAPLAARWLEYGTRALTGQQPDVPSAAEQAGDVVQGVAAGYGPKLVGDAADALLSKTVAHSVPVPRLDASGAQISPTTFVAGLKGSGAVPWLLRTGAEVAKGVTDTLAKPLTVDSISALMRSYGPAILAAGGAGWLLNKAVESGLKPTETWNAMKAGLSGGNQ